MFATATFTPSDRATIQALCADLSDRIGLPVLPEYDETECGQCYAALSVEALPQGAFGTPGPLVSLLTGPGVDGFAVMSAEGAPVVDGVTLEDAVKAASAAGVQGYRRKADGAI